jgi:hypothetical protein
MGRACSTYREKRNACRILMEKLEGRRDHWEDLNAGGNIVLKLILGR